MVKLDELKNTYKTRVASRMVHTVEGNVYTVGVDDAMKVRKLVQRIKKLEEELKNWKKRSGALKWSI